MKFVSISPHQSVWVVSINDISLIFLICPILQARTPLESVRRKISDFCVPSRVSIATYWVLTGNLGDCFGRKCRVWPDISAGQLDRLLLAVLSPQSVRCHCASFTLTHKMRHEDISEFRTRCLSVYQGTGWEFWIGIVRNAGLPNNGLFRIMLYVYIYNSYLNAEKISLLKRNIYIFCFNNEIFSAFK
jgi:hypothetical protein